jgi:hypothetical protein
VPKLSSEPPPRAPRQRAPYCYRPAHCLAASLLHSGTRETHPVSSQKDAPASCRKHSCLPVAVTRTNGTPARSQALTDHHSYSLTQLPTRLHCALSLTISPPACSSHVLRLIGPHSVIWSRDGPLPLQDSYKSTNIFASRIRSLRAFNHGSNIQRLPHRGQDLRLQNVQDAPVQPRRYPQQGMSRLSALSHYITYSVSRTSAASTARPTSSTKSSTSMNRNPTSAT